MPARDETGPLGQGSLTGRGLGPCGKGAAFRKGFGRGFGYKCWQRPVELTKEEKLKILKAEKEEIEKELKELGE